MFLYFYNTIMNNALKTFERQLQDIDLETVRCMLDICEDEVRRREKICEENGLCLDCETELVEDRQCDDSTGYNILNLDYCPNCK